MIKFQVNHREHGQLKSTIIAKQETKVPPIKQQITQKSKSKQRQQKSASKLDVKIQAKDKQVRSIASIQQTQSKVKKGLDELIEQYKSQAQKMMNNHGYDPEKQSQIRNHLRKLKKQKQERRIKFENDLKHLENKKQALDQSNSTDEKQKLQKRLSIEKRIEKIKDRQKRRQQQEAKFAQFYHQFKESKPLHKQLEEEFQKRQEKQKQQKITKFKQKLQEVYKPMDLQSLNQFSQKYMNNKYQLQKLRLQNQLFQKKRNEANMQKLNQLYKGHCHSVVLEELAQNNNKVNQSYQKYKRIRQYSQVVREQYKPRTVRSCLDTQEDESNGSLMPQTERGKRVVKDRYLKGQYQGKIVSIQKVPLSHSQQISKGMQYLQFLKSLPKKPKKQETSTIIPQIKYKTKVYKVPRQQNPLYQRSKRYNSIDFNVKQGDSDSVRRVMEFMRFRKQQLKLDQKLLRNCNPKNRSQWELQQKQFNSQLVSNIEEKLQILKRL